MILKDLIVHSKVNQTFYEEGVDSLDRTKDRNRFINWPSFSYVYNSRGFRDHEWPSNLKDAIWCVGDSFTLGVGIEFENIWPQVLSKQLNQRTINVSMNGASNNWLARRSIQILQEVQPTAMVIHWSFVHRREDPNTSLDDEKRRLWMNEHLERLDKSQEINIANLCKCMCDVESNKGQTNLIHSFIPHFSKEPIVNGIRPDTVSALLQTNVQHMIPEIEQVDFGRDNFHYHAKTIKNLVDQISSKIVK